MIVFVLMLPVVVASLGAAPGARAALPASVQLIAAEFDHEHALWTEVLKLRVSEDGFDYAGLKKDRSGLDRYMAGLREVERGDFEGWTREQRYAFWINAYNAHVVSLVVDAYPTSSIQNLGTLVTSVWKRGVVPLGRLHPKGSRGDLSLEEVENGILRPVFEDARVHAAINCASESCPSLRAEAFVATRLDAQLDQQARAWLANGSRNRFDRTGTKLYQSKIFDWFRKDFVRDAGSVQAWVALYAPDEHRRWVGEAKKIQVEYLDYSWKLNDAPSR